MTKNSDPNKQPTVIEDLSAKPKSHRIGKRVAGATLALTVAVTGSVAAYKAANNAPSKPGGEPRVAASAPDVYRMAPAAPGSFTRNPALEAKAAITLAEGLTGSFKPAVPGAQMGGDGKPGLIVMDGELEAVNTTTGETLRVVDPIVPSTELQVGDLATSSIVIEVGDTDGDGNPNYEARNLKNYDFVTSTPVDDAKPYLVAYGTLVDGKAGKHVLECGPNGEPIPNADIVGQAMTIGPTEQAQPPVATPTA